MCVCVCVCVREEYRHKSIFCLLCSLCEFLLLGCHQEYYGFAKKQEETYLDSGWIWKDLNLGFSFQRNGERRLSGKGEGNRSDLVLELCAGLCVCVERNCEERVLLLNWYAEWNVWSFGRMHFFVEKSSTIKYRFDNDVALFEWYVKEFERFFVLCWCYFVQLFLICLNLTRFVSYCCDLFHWDLH